MNIYEKTVFGFSSIALLGLLFGWSITLADDASVAGIYTLEQVDGENLPASSLASPVDGGGCERIVLEGALLLDSEGRSAAFLTERVTCPADSGPAAATREHSVIFAGTYRISNNQITVVDDFGTDRAVVEGDTLIYETGGEGRPVSRFLLKRE